MDLRNGTVDAPFGAHFAPVEDKFFSGWIQFHSEGILFLSFISVNTEIFKGQIFYQFRRELIG